MPDIQRELFRWAVAQPGAVGMALFGLGLLYAFLGFRFHTALLGLTCGFVGSVVGLAVGQIADLDSTIGLLAGTGIGVSLLFINRLIATVVATAAVWGTLGYYILYQFGMEPPTLTIAALALMVLGGGFACVCKRSAQAVLTSMQGVALMVVGWVGLASAIMPSVGQTFVDWASSWSLLVPFVMVMLFVTGYSYQSMNLRGDIQTGATG